MVYCQGVVRTIFDNNYFSVIELWTFEYSKIATGSLQFLENFFRTLVFPEESFGLDSTMFSITTEICHFPFIATYFIGSSIP